MHRCRCWNCAGLVLTLVFPLLSTSLRSLRRSRRPQGNEQLERGVSPLVVLPLVAPRPPPSRSGVTRKGHPRRLSTCPPDPIPMPARVSLPATRGGRRRGAQRRQRSGRARRHPSLHRSPLSLYFPLPASYVVNAPFARVECCRSCCLCACAGVVIGARATQACLFVQHHSSSLSPM